MISINKITSDSVIDYAAEELKKYLRMMMPESGEVKVSYAPSATAGFRLGLMQDFGLDVSDAYDTVLDDIIYIDCDTDGGIIAGDNPRSVLIAVYEYLRKNGCRWLFPGVDGEIIPLRSIEAVSYRHKASCRYRGPCIEGATSQSTLLDTIDFIPKAGMNMFMMQFFVPSPFYDRYYNHIGSATRSAEPICADAMLQWKTMCECEMEKRGIQFHDVGHGWTAAPFGIDCSSGWTVVEDDIVPEGARKYLAEVKGERKLYGGKVLNTQFCMSNPEARALVVNHIADYASKHTNVDYIHVWLGDDFNNHCECDACRERSVPDWYVILLNEIDRALSDRGLATKIVFIVYVETTWAPMIERIDNPARFTLMLAPITRSYTSTLTGKKVETRPFVRNGVVLPTDLDEYLAYFDKWKEVYNGSSLAFEYHFWKHQTFDLSGQRIAQRVFEDIEAYKARGVDGLIACGSQRAFFPNGFAYHVFARKQFDISLSFEELAEDYYLSAYGENWRGIYDYLAEIEKACSFKYLEREESEDSEISPLYSPRRAEMLAAIPDIVARGRARIDECRGSKSRAQAVSVSLLDDHATFVELYTDALRSKALGDDAEAHEKGERAIKFISEREAYIEKYYDVYLGNTYARNSLHLKGVPKVSTVV